jgi:Holliday junction DNA helicase RuvA
MIEHILGEILEKKPGHVVVMTGGVGYGLDIPDSTFSALPAPGGMADLFVQTHVREDDIHLFGFATRDERQVFRIVQGVSGIGPAMALSILSCMPLSAFARAVEAGETDAIVRIKGIGKRTAERIIVELRDKLKGFAPGGPAAVHSVLDDRPESRDAVAALVNLGMKEAPAQQAVAKAIEAMSDSATVEQLVVEALKRRK